MKRVYVLCIVTSLIMGLLSFGIHGLTKTEEKHIKVGFIFVGDEITPYTENFIKARNHVMEVYGDQIECVTKYNVIEDQIEEPLKELVDEKCDYIIAASYGYGPEVKKMAQQHPEMQDKVIENCIDGKTYEQDAMAGIDKGWVRILDVNYAIVP